MVESGCELLTPSVTAYYTHHDCVALKAVEGWTQLLGKTDFSADAKDGLGACESHSLSFLDSPIQTDCNVATTTSQETVFGPCVAFVERDMALTNSSLRTQTNGIVVRSHLFIFHLRALIPTYSVASNPD